MRRTLTAVLAVLALVVTASASALPSTSSAAPVLCPPLDAAPGVRVFPEPATTATFLRFVDFECGVRVLADRHRGLVELVVLGESSSGYPLYDVELTDESLPREGKQHLFVLSSIHGNEMAGREGAARVIEDMVDPALMGEEAFVRETLERFVVHFVFPNPDGWVNGEVVGAQGAGVNYTRQNDGPPARDLNRNFPVQGYLRVANGTLDQPEGRAVDALLRANAGAWSYGTDNHGQGVKPVAASGLQIVGEFDYTKSERLAAYADAIEPAMAEFGATAAVHALNQETGHQVAAYEWGTLYDILGYSAAGSGIDYYNTPGVVGGTGFATEMTAANNAFSNTLTHPGLVNQLWVDTTRAINYTMMRQALDPPEVEFPVGGRAAYVFDPAVVRHDDADGYGAGNPDPDLPASEHPGGHAYQPYAATRMRFFEDLDRDASQPLTPIRVGDVLADPALLDGFDSLVLADDPMPEDGDPAAWGAALRRFVDGGGNLILTDASLMLLEDLGLAPDGSVAMRRADVGFADFVDGHALNAGLRGVASQTYDVIPIGYPDNAGEAPNWTVATSAVDGQGGSVAGTNGTGRAVYGEYEVPGGGRVRFLGALLPQPTEEHYHPFGLQDYAVTYTGYTLLANMLAWERPAA